MTDDRVRDLVDRLTREEKLRLVHGAVDPAGTATGYLPGVERLDIPPLRLVDGPLGIRVPGEPATAFPASIALASTFDPTLARRQGEAMAAEAQARGQDAVLGPGLNLIRVPHCGRNFEYFSEDPLVTSAFAAGVVDGLQSGDVIATPKHFVANNQETGRVSVSAEVDERALRELYLPGFRAAVEAGAGSVMTAYNRVNGTHASAHRRLLTDVLKGEWGFDGYVVSDWFGTESTVGAATAGLDLEMPGISMAEMMAALGPEDAEVDPEDGEFDPEDAEVDPEDAEFDPEDADFDPEDADFDPEDADLEEFAGNDALPTPGPDDTGLFGAPLGEAIDDGAVPAGRLDDMVARILGQMDRVGLLDAEREPTVHDRDGGALDSPDHRALAEEIATRAIVLLENDGVLPLADAADVAVVGPGVEDAMLGGGGSSEMEPFDETSTAGGIRSRAGGTVTVERGHPPVETPSFLPGSGADDGDRGGRADPDDAVAAAREADVAVVVVRDAAGEAADRDSLALPGDQDDLIEAVAAANDRTVVAVQSSGPVEVPWREDVAAVLASWYPGQADGDALAAVLYGDADPSGRLPVTVAPEGTYPTSEERAYPGVDGEVHYDEGVFVGYRHFDAVDADPTYPFGHGRSYATFEYGDATLVDGALVDGALVDGATIRVAVENVADRAGREVVQAYVRPPSVAGVERPVRELAGFAAVEIEPGESTSVEIALDEHALARYDEAEGWTVDDGEYAVEVGRSSRDVRVETSLRGEDLGGSFE